MNRRGFLGSVAGALAALALRPSRSLAAGSDGDFFIFIHAAGGWDVTLWADPRNERKGLVEPASSGNTDTAGLRHWRSASLDGDTQTFQIVSGTGALRLGPAIGDLHDLHDRLTINGIAMNTVSHEDGTTFSVTGRHRTGGTLPESSLDVLIANELGTGQQMPDVSIKFPSAFIGDRLDRRAVPMRIGSVEAIAKSFARSDQYLAVADRQEISAILTEEATQLARGSSRPAPYQQLASQHAAQAALLSGDFVQAFGTKQLQASYPQFNYKGRNHGPHAVSAAFALEAMRRNLVRCVCFSLGGLDTHNANYRHHATTLQELFDVVATIVKTLDTIPHPTKAGSKLADRTHILVLSEFCRTPQINPGGGRDHYPNNSALVISPKFRSGRSFGATDLEQLLPVDSAQFSDGRRPITPPDVLATFLGALGIEARRYMRDGEVVKAMLA
ncbi:MAG: DUF1501 domain-containing protein [Kofleriaceae bacterium]